MFYEFENLNHIVTKLLFLLETYFAVKRQLLRFQSPITGLFPVLSSDLHIGSVRDSIYCASAVWGLYQAYR